MYIGAIPTPAATESRQEFTATANQTVFSTTGGTVGFCDCFLNGVKMANSDFSFDGADVTLTSGAAAGDTLAVVMRQADNALVALPIKDSAGNNVLSETSSTVTLTADEANVGSNALVVNSSGDVSIKGDSGGIIFDVNSQTTDNNVIFATFRGGLTSPTAINALQFASFRFASQNDRTGLYWENQGVGNVRMWMDDSLLLRVSSGWPTAHNSGTVVGTQSSDIRLKNILGNVEYGLSEILQLIPKKFSFKTEPEVQQIGFLAQEVLPVIPEAVFDSKDVIEGYESEGTKLGMTYVSLIPVLVNAIKEQQTLIESQQSQIHVLSARIETLEAAS